MGKARAVEQVEIYWPVSRKTQTLRGLPLDRFYAVREDQDQATPMQLKTFPWPGMSGLAVWQARQ